MADPAIGPLLAALVRCFAPLPTLLGDEARFAGFVRSLDPAVRFDVDALAAVVGGLAGPAAAIAGAVEDAADAAGDLGSNDADTRAEAAGALLDAAGTVAGQLAAVAAVVSDWDLADLGLGPEHRDPAFWAALLATAFDRLVIEAIEQRLPVLHGLAALAGIIVRAADGTLELRLDALGPAIGDLPGTFAGQAGWGGALSPDWLTGPLSDAVADLGLDGRVRPLRPALAELLPGPQPADARAVEVPFVSGFQRELGALAELGVILAAVSAGGGTPADALLLANLAWGASSLSSTSASGWTLTVAGTAELSGTLALLVEPGRTTDVAGGAAGSLGVTVARTASPRWRPFGTPASTRLEVGSAEAGVELIAGAGREVVLSAGVGDAEVVLATESPFLAVLLGAEQISAPFALELRWSTASGFTIAGSVGVFITVNLDRDIGPVFLDRLELAAVVGTDGGADGAGSALELSARLSATATLGPFTFSVDGLGIAFGVGPADGGPDSIGPLLLRARPLPPRGYGATLVAPLCSGGGFILIDRDGPRYAGGLAIDIAGVGITAFAVVDTDLPGGGWALYATLTADFPVPIPIGFGFTLAGVGGILAVNRTIDVDALALGLRAGAADAVLFPDNPAEDALTLLGNLDQWFPLADGSTVVGPVVRIGWGVPELVSAQVGVMVVVPDLIVVLLASITAVLPDADAAILTLHADVLGAVDVPAGTITVVASLYDSTLLGVFELSGDVGFHAALSGQPFFVLSIGGFHPEFKPPGAMPSSLLDLRVMRFAVELSENVSISLESYLAITSNTVQFGARVDLEASVEVLLTTYTARGWVGFDVLLTLTPLSLSAQVVAGVSVSAGDRELFGVDLSLHLQGPDPWHAVGRAVFDFFGFHVDYLFDIGEPPAIPPRDPVDVGARVRAALDDDAAWQPGTGGADWAAGLVTAAAAPPAPGGSTAGGWTGPAIRPDQSLVVRQSVAPLNRELTAFGELTPTAPTVALTAPTIGRVVDATPDWVDDWFAPAQFDRLAGAASLSAPSYDLMTAGVVLADDTVDLPTDPAGQCRSVSRLPEEDVYGPVGDARTRRSRVAFAATAVPAPPLRRGVGTATVRRPDGTTVPLGAVAVTTTRYAVVDRTDGRAAPVGTPTPTGRATRAVPLPPVTGPGGGLSFAAAVRSLGGTATADRRVVPLHAVVPG